MAHTSGRSNFWRVSIEDAIKHPLLGVGPTRFACGNEMRFPAHPHSFPFRVLGEWGLIALFLILILAIRIGLSFLKQIKNPNKESQTDPPIRAMLGISLIAGAIHACLSGLLIMPASQIAAILIAGWTLSLSGKALFKPESTPITRYLPVAGVFVSCAILLFAIVELTQLSVRTSYSAQHSAMIPRFWQDGKVCEYRYTNPLSDE